VETTRLSSKGHITLPESVREARHWRAGTEFLVESTDEGVLLRPLKPLLPSRLDEVAGRLAASHSARSIVEIDDAIDAELAVRRDRGRY
jgi:AbrB family looped-hinge helix DNA binding protein